jgi:hypothetical protein
MQNGMANFSWLPADQITIADIEFYPHIILAQEK